MSFQITVIEGPDQGRSFSLDDGSTLTIGRGEKSDTRLDDATVSRVHCEIARHGNTVTLRDLNSSSGTRVNGNPIEQTELFAGNVIQIGESQLRLNLPTLAGQDTIFGDVDRPAARPLDELVGKNLGRYHIESIIGRGVSGIVFKATDTEKNRVAALKVLTPHFSTKDEHKQRFVRAMKTMLPIRDPHIIRLYNAGINGPYCWAAMELIDGENLAQLIHRTGIEGMLDWRKVWRVAMNIGQALQAAFEHKVIHRNLTPTNILQRSSDGVCLLGDLMLAKALEGQQAQQVTQIGQIVGEVSYLSPERTGSNMEIDTRSDIYGLGATCYALLTGKPPAEGKSLPELIDNIRQRKPTKPKEFQLSINEIFQDVVMTMIEKDPADRFENPAALLKELERIGKYNSLKAD